MAPPKNYILGYHPANQEEALIVQSYLSKAGYKLTHFNSSTFNSSGEFAKSILNSNQSGILLVSDNFLKSEDCLLNLYEVYKEVKNHKDFEIIVCDGKIKDDENDYKIVETSFKKLSGVIKYLNFWQNKYLETRSKKTSIPETEIENFGNYLRIIRSISTQVGDFLKSLTESGIMDFKDLTNTNFENFYIRVNDSKGFETYLQNLAKEAAKELVEIEPEPQTVDLKKSISKEFPIEKHAAESTKNPIPEVLSLSGIVSMTDFQTPDEIIDEIEKEENMKVVEIAEDNEVEDLDALYQKEKATNKSNGQVSKIIKKAQLLFKKENQADGLKILKEGLETNPKNSTLKYEYGASLARYAGSLNLAKFHLKENLENDPQHTKTLFLLGKMAELEGNHQTAINFYSSVLDNHPDFPDVNFRLGLLMLINNSPNINKIEKCFRNELKLNPKNTEANYRLATLLAENTNNSSNALQQFQRVLNLEPTHKFVNYDIALLYYKMGDMDKAKLYYDKACGINPELRTQDNDIAFGIRKVVKRVNTHKKSLPIIKKSEGVVLKTPVQIPVTNSTKTILITGATSGIGKAIAMAFAEAGNARLILTGRRVERLEEMKSNLATNKIAALTLSFDVRNNKEVEKAIQSIPEDWRKIDILVNNAGLAKGFEPIHEGNLDHWETMIDTNFKGMLYMTRLVAPFMVSRKSGHIINICSIAGKEVYPNGGVYCATKHAVDALTKGMRIDLHKYNIRVSQIAPGHVEDTEFAEVRYDGDKEKAKIYEDFKPVTSKDVAEVVYFIATRPAHVNIQDVLMMGTQQASATIIDRSGRA